MWGHWAHKHKKSGEVMKSFIVMTFLLIANTADNATITWPEDKADLIVIDNEPDVLVEFGIIYIKEITWNA